MHRDFHIFKSSTYTVSVAVSLPVSVKSVVGRQKDEQLPQSFGK